jgi:hypothetical protein
MSNYADSGKFIPKSAVNTREAHQEFAMENI